MKTLFLGSADIEKLITLPKVVEAVESAFRWLGKGEAEMPAKLYMFYPKHGGDIRVMPAYLPAVNISGVKIVNVHPNNMRRRLPTVMGTYVLIDPRNGFPLAVMDATRITQLRTGAAAGVATKYLARKNAELLAVVGTGGQASTQVEAVLLVRKIKAVNLYDARKGVAAEFARRHRSKHEAIEFRPVHSVEKCVSGADVVCTITPSRSPIVKSAWIWAGCHINAMGADAPGKQELEPALLKRAKIVIDAWEQARHSGEINVALAKKAISRRHIHGDLGSIVAGTQPGRTGPDDITIFDSTGLALQDLTTAYRIYKLARQKKAGLWLDMVG